MAKRGSTHSKPRHSAVANDGLLTWEVLRFVWGPVCTGWDQYLLSAQLR